MVSQFAIVRFVIMNMEDIFLLSSIILVIVSIILLACKMCRGLKCARKTTIGNCDIMHAMRQYMYVRGAGVNKKAKHTCKIWEKHNFIVQYVSTRHYDYKNTFRTQENLS